MRLAARHSRARALGTNAIRPRADACMRSCSDAVQILARARVCSAGSRFGHAQSSSRDARWLDTASARGLQVTPSPVRHGRHGRVRSSAVDAVNAVDAVDAVDTIDAIDRTRNGRHDRRGRWRSTALETVDTVDTVDTINAVDRTRNGRRGRHG